MNPYMKLIRVVYSLFAVVVFLPLGWTLAVKVSGLLSDERFAALVGFGGAALFLGLPLIVFAVRTRSGI